MMAAEDEEGTAHNVAAAVVSIATGHCKRRQGDNEDFDCPWYSLRWARRRVNMSLLTRALTSYQSNFDQHNLTASRAQQSTIASDNLVDKVINNVQHYRLDRSMMTTTTALVDNSIRCRSEQQFRSIDADVGNQHCHRLHRWTPTTTVPMPQSTIIGHFHTNNIQRTSTTPGHHHHHRLRRRHRHSSFVNYPSLAYFLLLCLLFDNAPNSIIVSAAKYSHSRFGGNTWRTMLMTNNNNNTSSTVSPVHSQCK